MKAIFAIALLATAMLCAIALAQENTADSWYKKGQDLERMGSWKEAVAAYDQAINLNPRYAEAWSAKGNVLSMVSMGSNSTAQNETIENAIDAANKALKLDPNNGKFWFSKGMVLAQIALATANQSRYNESLQDFDKAIEIAGTNKTMQAEGWYGKGYTLNLMGNSAEALEAHSKATELNESYVEAWVGKATALSRLERYEDAISAYDKVFEIYTSDEKRLFDYPYLWYSKARALEKLGREEEATQAYNKSVEDADKIIAMVGSGQKFYMNLSEAWQYKGQLLEEMGRYEEAVNALDNVTKINPDSIGAWNEKGFLLATELGRYNESIEAYDRALKIDPNNGDAMVGKGNVLRSLGRYDEADELFNKALQIDSIDSRLYYLLAKAWLGKGEVLRNQGKYNESIEAYDKSIELDPRYPEDALIGKGMALESLGRHGDAINAYNQSLTVYEKAVKNNPKRADIWYGYGNALAGPGRYNEAIGAYEKAILLNPNYAGAWYEKGYALWHLGRDSEANIAFDRARELGYKAPAYASSTDLLRITNVTSLGEDEFIELIYTGNKTQSFKNLRLVSENKSLVLPDFTLQPNGKIRIHFGQGVANRTDLFLNNKIALNDLAGNLTLKDLATGVEKFMSYWTPGLAQENTVGYWVEKGNKLVDNGSYEEALTKYNKAIQIDPENLDARDRKALVLYILEQQAYRDVLSLSEKRLEKNPKDAGAWQARAAAQSSLGEEEEANSSRKKALAIYDQEIQENPGNATAWFYKAELTTNNTEAFTAYEKVIELNGSMKIPALITKSNILLNLGKSEEATLAIDEAIRLSPNSSDVWIQKALNSYALGKYNESLAAYEKIIELKPGVAWLWKGKGDALKALGRQAEADEAYAKAKELGLVV